MIKIYTDGSCNWKTRLGGCGVYIKYENGEEKLLSKGYKDTTIDRCEIRAIIMALNNLENKRQEVGIWIDRENVYNTIKNKYIAWSQLGRYEGMNDDLWNILFKRLSELRLVKIKLFHIKSHTKKFDNEHVLGNEIADILADYKQFVNYKQDGINKSAE